MNNPKIIKTEATYKKMAYDYIYEKIARGLYVNGDRIVSKTIAKEMKISLAPVREAIMEMAASGLIEYRPHAGAVVRDVSKRELLQYLKLRILVEPFAAKEAAKYASNKDLVTLEKIYQHMQDIAKDIDKEKDPEEQSRNFIRFNHADMCFHIEMLKATNNLALKRFGQLLMDSFYLNGIKHNLSENKYESRSYHIKESLDTHLVVLRALLKRDPKQAEEAMRNSLTIGHQNILEDEPTEDSLPYSLNEELINTILG